MDDTIAAVSSGAPPSGIAVVRVSGPQAADAIKALAGPLPEPRRARLRAVCDGDGGLIDRGIVIFFDGPSTATGEDIAEFHLHGGRAVVAACLAALVTRPGIRLAMAGEFTRRAFENGRIDLTEAEGLADLLQAETEAQRREALARSAGSLKSLYEGWRTDIINARALIEASLDFADEGDVADDIALAAAPIVRRLRAAMQHHLDQASRGEILRHGFRVVIAGPPNVGKSSLLNALAEREVAIVTEVAGTTRDVLDVTVDLEGMPVRFSDTAGLRKTDDPVEAIGIERARAAASNAHLVLFLTETGSGDAMTHVKHFGSEPVDAPLLRIASKSDLAGAAVSQDCDLAISVATGAGLSELTRRIADAARVAIGDPGEAVPMRVRHRAIVGAACESLSECLATSMPPEIAAETLRRASDRLGELTGRVGVEDLLDVVFSQFCIGK